MKKSVILVLVLALAGFLAACQQSTPRSVSDPGAERPAHREMTSAVHDILTQSALEAVAVLGQQGGFSQNQAVYIPLPEQIQPVARVLETFGQGGMVSELEQGMNRAAEQALPGATGILLEAIANMHIEDVLEVVKGPDDAATQFLERTTRTQLLTELTPLVAEATQDVGVISLYRTMVQTAQTFSPMPVGALDLDAYVASKALDGLFYEMARQEAVVRQDPAQAATSAARNVFNYFR